MKPDQLDVSDIVEIGDQYYILATSALAQHQDRVLKHDDTFALFDRFGDIKPVGRGEEGLFHQNTRFLSRLLVRVGRDRPMLLSSRVKNDNGLLAIDLTNFDVKVGEKLEIQRGTVYLARTILLWNGICYERLMVRNFGRKAVDLTLIVSFDSVRASHFCKDVIVRDRYPAEHRSDDAEKSLIGAAQVKIAQGRAAVANRSPAAGPRGPCVSPRAYALERRADWSRIGLRRPDCLR